MPPNHESLPKIGRRRKIHIAAHTINGDFGRKEDERRRIPMGARRSCLEKAKIFHYDRNILKLVRTIEDVNGWNVTKEIEERYESDDGESISQTCFKVCERR